MAIVCLLFMGGLVQRIEAATTYHVGLDPGMDFPDLLTLFTAHSTLSDDVTIILYNDDASLINRTVSVASKTITIQSNDGTERMISTSPSSTTRFLQLGFRQKITRQGRAVTP